MKSNAKIIVSAPAFLLLATTLSSFLISGEIPEIDSSIIITNVNVVDVLSGKIIPAQDVMIKGERIQFIGQGLVKNIPKTALRVDGTGKYLAPGLWDMHAHIGWLTGNDELIFPLLLRKGIVGFRDMGGDIDVLKSFREKSKIPAIYAAGPMIDGNPPVHADFSMAVSDNVGLELRLDSLKKNGVDFFKTYSLLKEPQLKLIAAYSRSHRMSFAGHLSEYVDPEVSIALGQRSVEHLNRIDEIWKNDPERITAISKLMVKNRTFLCPTLVTYQLKTRLRDSLVNQPGYNQYIPDLLMQEWKGMWAKRKATHVKAGDWTKLESEFQSQKKLVKFLSSSGVMILAGSDFAGMPYVYPAVGLHEELSLLVEAGLTNWEALKTATINPAIFMSIDGQAGSVTPGKYADLILLDKDPLANIRNITSIKETIVHGKIVRP